MTATVIPVAFVTLTSAAWLDPLHTELKVIHSNGKLDILTTAQETELVKRIVDMMKVKTFVEAHEEEIVDLTIRIREELRAEQMKKGEPLSPPIVKEPPPEVVKIEELTTVSPAVIQPPSDTPTVEVLKG